MRLLLTILIMLFCDLVYCQQLIYVEGNTISERFKVPSSYDRIDVIEHSFAQYLRNLPLKTHMSPVLYFNGQKKLNHNVYMAVVDMEIGSRDLQQCADAVMRLRGEYLYKQKKYEDIHFNFLSDGKPRYFTSYANSDYSYKKFRKYMDYIFSYANTTSLFNEMKSVSISEMQIGDVFIQKGRPYGHAVIVIDMAENAKGERVYMLAQSYMPAQDIQILVNRGNAEISPWYKLKEGVIRTPEWDFTSSDLKRFTD